MTTTVDSVAARTLGVRQTVTGVQALLPALSAAGQFIVVMDNADSTLKASVNGGAYLPFSLGVATVTLDSAYDGGGAGLGRTITGDAGAVVINANAANNNNALEINKNPVGAQAGVGILVTMGAAASANGIRVNSSTTTQDAACFRAELLTVVAAVHGPFGFEVQRTGTPLAGGDFRGRALNIVNTPGGAAAYTERGILISISHVPVSAAATDTTQAIAITMTPAAASAVTGLNVQMGPLVSAAGFAANFDWRATAGTAAGNGVVNITIGAVTVLAAQIQFLVIDLGAATTFGGDTTGIVINLLTNATAAATNVFGIDISLPSTTSVASAGIRITIPTADEDTIPYFSLGGCDFFADEGAPNNANGADGDFYFRKDTPGGTAAFFTRIGGAWTSIGALP